MTSVLTIRSARWQFSATDSMIDGEGDPFDDPANKVRFAGALIIDFRHLSWKRQAETVTLPVIDVTLPRGMVREMGGVRVHESGRVPGWLSDVAPDVYAKLAEALGAKVTRPDEVPA